MNKFLLLFTIGLFILSIFCGIYAQTYVSKTLIIHKETSSNIDNKNCIAIFILKNNFYTIFLLLLGSLTLGVTTFYTLVFNGLCLGIVFSSSLQRISIMELISLTLPHGIFEIPAIIIAGAAGFKIPYEIIRYLMGKKEKPLTKEDIKEYLTLALISIVLIVIAAWIEANITLKIAQVMLRKGI